MIKNLRIGIRHNNQEKEKIVLDILNKIKCLIKNKGEFLYDFKIEDYEVLKKEVFGIHKNHLNSFEKKGKAITEYKKGIILINNLFFNTPEVHQKSVLIHEIGHIINKPSLEVDINNCLIDEIYVQYLADSYLFDIDKDIFLEGRIIPELNFHKIDKIKKKLEISNNKEKDIKGKFIIIGRLYYLYFLYQYPPILAKIEELIVLIKEYFTNIDFILENIKDLCNQLKSKEYKELEGLFYKTVDDIDNLNRRN